MGVADLGRGAQGDMYFLWQNSRSFLAWRSLDLATPKDPQGVEAVLHASVFFGCPQLPAQEQGKSVLLTLVGKEV